MQAVVGATNAERLGSQEPLQIPPTRAPRRWTRAWPRWWRMTAAAVTVVVVGVSVSAFLNREVTRRLAVAPLVTTATSHAISTTTVLRSSSTPDTPSTESQTIVLGATETTSTTAVETEPQPEVRQSGYDIIAKLDRLPVSDENSLGYTRFRFGSWRDDDGDSCTTRDDIMISQAIESVSRNNPCEIISGRWLSPYDAATVTDVAEIRVDHVVSLFEAWKSGAWDWTDDQRNDYLNDIGSAGAILAVSVQSEDEKADRDPSDWMPSSKAFHCRYLQTWVDMKTEWKLSVDAGERESIAAAALDC